MLWKCLQAAELSGVVFVIASDFTSLMSKRESKVFQALSPRGKGFHGDNLSLLNNVLGLGFHLSLPPG